MKKHASIKQAGILNGQGILAILIATFVIGFILYNVLNQVV